MLGTLATVVVAAPGSEEIVTMDVVCEVEGGAGTALTACTAAVVTWVGSAGRPDDTTKSTTDAVAEVKPELKLLTVGM